MDRAIHESAPSNKNTASLKFKLSPTQSPVENEVLVFVILHTTVHELKSRLKGPQNGHFLPLERDQNLKENVRRAQDGGKVHCCSECKAGFVYTSVGHHIKL